jgi:anti-anti-sigma regulatory factor
MQNPALAWLEQDAATLSDDLARRLRARAGSVFRALGEDESRRLAADLLAALRTDLTSDSEQPTLREFLARVTTDLLGRGLGYADLRLLGTSTRQVILAALATADPDPGPQLRARVDEWLFQLVLLAAQRFVAQRERSFQEQTARLEVRQLEDQLVELKAAFAEKTKLLDVIRQASTPIAPVHDGILVVPLVGMFDAARAQVLTEAVLTGVTQARAQVVILDISGVPVFDIEAAEHIIRTAGAVRLLGATLILVGLSPTVASTIVELGVDLTGLITLGSLQAGLARALALRKLQIVPIAAVKR